MLHILLSIAPIFALIVLGHALRRGGIPSLDFWNVNDKLVYWVLFPALLFYKVSTISLSGAQVVPHALVMYGALACTLLFALVALIYGAVPTAPGGFTLARQMGGDAPVMAGMITLQTVVAFVTLPATLALGYRLLGTP